MLSKKILNNTIMLYCRQLLLLLVSLYTVRVVLNTLGIEDFGVYSVVAGIVTLCSFLSGSMASATQRFFSFAIGKKDNTLLDSTFSVTLVIYLLIALVVLLLLEGPGLWFVINELNIPSDRIESVQILYQFSVATFFFTVLTAPFIAIIIAHEDMKYFALISLAEAVLKLISVLALVYASGDKLVAYGVILFLIAVVTLVLYANICFKSYSECQVKTINWDSNLLKKIFAFTGWTLFGQLTTAARLQAVTILINQFFSPSLAASRAIAMTISSKINIFSNNFNTSLYPPIIKSYANNDTLELFSLICNGSKITFFMMWVIGLPLLIEVEMILSIWLGILPEQVVIFTKLAIIESLILSISLPLATAARAPGKMKVYELVLGGLQLIIFLLSYLILSLGYPAFSVFIVAIIINIVMFFARLKIVSGLIGISQVLFIKKVCLPMTALVLITSFFAILAKYVLPIGFVYSTITILICTIISMITMYYIGLEKVWREKLLNVIKSKVFHKGKI